MKKLLLFLLIAVSGFLLAMHKWKSNEAAESEEANEKPSNITVIRRSPLKMKTIDISVSTARTFYSLPPVARRIPMSLTRSEALDPDNLQIPEESARPWYMKGGQLYPKNSVINATIGIRSVKIFPDELPGEDRIPGMYNSEGFSTFFWFHLIFSLR